MALKLLQVTAPIAAQKNIQKIAEKEGVIAFHKECETDDDHAVFSLLTDSTHRQTLVDMLQELSNLSPKFRINILPVDTTIPTTNTAGSSDTREELKAKMAQGALLDFNYLLLTFLSTIVALIGLLQDNIAVVIGAMVIAPFLGPNLAFAFATSLGNKGLMTYAFRTGLVGVGFASLIGVAFGYLWGAVPDSAELMGRTSIGLDGVALAVASGVAGVLSLTSGLSMTLVGVMVAVAILPPAATFGFMLGAGQVKLAYGALLMVSVNIVCVNLAGLLVFLAKGISPRRWFEKRMAKPFVYGGIMVWSVLLALLIYAIRNPFL
ncbi:MAG: TIGR00341 family protein [Kordiimonadaceae bacterium]|nr:TIGR00341 family protein [Kordiimonadaceae bacterium]MBO6569028.1 TIGR00341 family protein [Kordiimonadaceae bacterium]MBO6964503.1 TIGR00341 family protein [Kordiimonadaceae bacterium]